MIGPFGPTAPTTTVQLRPLLGPAGATAPKPDDGNVRRFLRRLVPDTRRDDAERRDMLADLAHLNRRSHTRSRPELARLRYVLTVVHEEDRTDRTAQCETPMAPVATAQHVERRLNALVALTEFDESERWLRHLSVGDEQRRAQCAAFVQLHVLRWLYRPPYAPMLRRSMRELELAPAEAGVPPGSA